MLCTFLHNWDQLNFDLIWEEDPVPLVLRLTGGFVATARCSLDEDQHWVTIVAIRRLPSPSRAIDEKSWVMYFPFVTDVWAYSPAQGLIAMASIVDGYVEPYVQTEALLTIILRSLQRLFHCPPLSNSGRTESRW